MISVDGDRDTPAVMKAYLAPLSPDFIGLTGDTRSVRKIAANFSAVFFKGLPADNSGQYLVDHTSQVYLVDTQGRLRATFFDASVEQMLQSTQDVAATNRAAAEPYASSQDTAVRASMKRRGRSPQELSS